MDVPKVAPRSAANELAGILDSTEVRRLIADIEATRWTGRPGHPIRTMIGLCLVKSLYAIPTWTRTVRLVREHAALQAALGCGDTVPSEWACYRFTAKLRAHSAALTRCLDRVTAGLHALIPHMGESVAIDASDMPAYANGQRYLSKNGPERERYSDPEASWGHRSAVSTRKGGGFYGYKLHMAVCTKTDLPLAWSVESARANESTTVAPLLDAITARGFAADTCAMDKGYDIERVYAECEERDCRPIIPLRNTTAVARGDHKPPVCEHGTWRFAGADVRRGAAKWRCPTGECKPASVWIKADRLHPLIPRETPRFRKLYKQRGAVEREFGRLKNDWALAPLRVRGLDCVRLHADLTVLAQLSRALGRARSLATPPRAASLAARAA